MSELHKYKKYLEKDFRERIPRSSKYSYRARNVSSSSSSDKTEANVRYDLSSHYSDGEYDAHANLEEHDDRHHSPMSYTSTRSRVQNEPEVPSVTDYINVSAEMEYDDGLSDDCEIRDNHNEINDMSYEHNFEDDFYNSSSDDEAFQELDDDNLMNSDQSFTNLKKIIQSKEGNEIIKAKFVVNQVEVLLAIAQYSAHYSLSNSATADLCKMINSFVNTPIVPDSRYRIDKLFYPGDNIEYHAICTMCKTYIKKFDKTMQMLHCEVCNDRINLKDPSYCDYFVTIEIEDQLRHLIEANAEYYTTIMFRERVPNVYKDIYDGNQYQYFLSTLSEEQRKSYATLVFNSDGSPVFKSSKFSIWPIQIVVNELPFFVRNKKPILCALWFGHDKPNMTYFLPPFVSKINTLSNEGLLCQVNGDVRKVYIYALCCCVDSVARAPMQGTVQFNGYYGCEWCLHPGQLVPHDRGNAMKYPLIHEVIQRRTEIGTLCHLEEAINSGRPVCGVKKPSPLLNLSKFDIIDGFVPDSMHCICLGVVKQFTEYWCNTSNECYSLSNNDILKIDDQLKKFQVSIQIARLSRSLNDRKFWKSREWENWLLYYNLPLLKEIPRMERFVNHWAMLVQAFHMLMANSITSVEINSANHLLIDFVSNAEQLYTKDAMSYNVHQLLHIHRSVQDWGPIWSHYGYPFESGNGQILRTVHAAKGVLNQVCRNISLNESLVILEKQALLQEDANVIDFCRYLNSRHTEKSFKLCGNRYFGKSCKPKTNFIEHLNLCNERTESYHKLIKNKILFKSCKKQAFRSNNSYAQTTDGQFVQIVEFMCDRQTNQEFTLCKRIEIKDIIPDLCTAIKQIVNIRNEELVIKTENLQQICVFMKIYGKQYITPVPNIYWCS